MKSFLIGLLLLPFTLATYYHLPSFLFSVQSEVKTFLPLAVGGILYIFIELIFSRPMRTYVFGHELTHALASILMGGKVHSFNVSKEGGSVSLSKSNFFIALAPYCFPIYTLLIIFLYFILKFWISLQLYQIYFLGMIGYSLMFHISLTLHAIQQGQPDIRKTGYVFSLIFIGLINAWMVVFLYKFLFKDLVSMRIFFMDCFKTQWIIWEWTFLKTYALIKLTFNKLHEMYLNKN